MLVGKLLQEPLSILGASLWGAVIAVILVHVLWACGIHGATIVGGVMSPIWLSLMDREPDCFSSGPRCTEHDYCTVFDLWIYMGGSGATLALVVGIFIVCTKSAIKKFRTIVNCTWYL
ncbi:PTS transporter subunit EIIC [Bacillus pacificus]